MPDRHPDLVPDNMYHAYSRAIGNEKLFLSDENYRFFLSKFKEYILPVAEVYAWVLLPNHFHFMIRMNGFEDVSQYYLLKKGKRLLANDTFKFLMQCFSNFLNSYTKAFNKVNNRKGALFIDYLRRVEIADDEQMGATAFYIHKNPVHHGCCKKMEEWKWSSYKSYLTKEPSTQASIELLE